MQLSCAGRLLDLHRPVVMGVLNVTPDSFSDGGVYQAPEAALAQAERMAADGAAIIDIGGESTRPGASPVSSEEELRRVLPVVERVAARVSCVISIDTSNPELMRRAASAGAHLINDVRALRRPGALEALASGTLGVCLMHMLGEPATMQADPRYQHVVTEVRAFLASRAQACSEAGIAPDRVCVDPGFGFGKRQEHNLQLLHGLPQLASLGLPIVVGLSRKSIIAALIGMSATSGRSEPGSQRLAGSLALAVIAVLQGARIVRAHDVAATLDAIRVAGAYVLQQGS
jgi:dihydropteroate synthase